MAIKVLVVDDEPDVAVIFRQKFRRRIAAEELEFSFAENGRVALDLLVADPEISLVFTDIRMPSMDGLTFLKEMRVLDRQVLLPLVVSAYDDMPNIREAMRQGAWDFVTKPIDLDDLERVLNHAITEIQQKLDAIATSHRLLATEQDRQAALRAKELQQEFFENITHEFRTPLTLLLAPLESALGLSSEPQVVEYLGLAQKSGLLLQDLINQLLDFAKVDAQQMQPQLLATPMSKLVESLCDAFQVVAAQKQIRFEVVIPPDLAGMTDQRMLGRILLNLLSNAFKFTPPHGQVRCEFGREETLAFLRIQDTGTGLSQSETQNIFKRFQPGSNQQAIGSGLGLAICHSLATVLGGQIVLEDLPPFRTSFRVEFPVDWLGVGELDSMETTFGASVSPSFLVMEGAELELGNEAGKSMILIAEDHPDMRRYLSQVLHDEYNVVSAENGKVAYAMAQELIPDLVLTDWMMPEMTGLQLLENLRAMRETSHIPVVMLTAKAGWEDKIQGLETGSEAFLPKPFHPEELKAVVRNLFAQRERLRERFRMELLRPDKFAAASLEDQFIMDVKRVMEGHLMDEQFGVETMADAMAMSRRTLMRKLTAVTGQAPVKFIRAYRLERALQMLQDNTAPVWEIAVKTGFGSASYFTKCFKDHYGMSPKEAIHQN